MGHCSSHILSVHHGKRFEDLGSLSDLDTAIFSSKRTIDMAPLTGPDQPAMLNNSGHLSARRYEMRGSMDDFRQPIHFCEQAI
jgi:hypothetical protein